MKFFLIAFNFFLMSVAFAAQEYGRHESVAAKNKENIGLTKTLNKYGFISNFLADPYTADFIIFSSEVPGRKVLEVGAEFGKLALEILRNGGPHHCCGYGPPSYTIN